MGIGFNALGDEPITLESMSKLRAAYDPQLAMQRKLALLQGQGTAAGMDMSQFLNTTSQAPVVVDDEFNVQGSGRMGTAVAGLNAMANAVIGGDIRKQKEADLAQKQGVIDEQRNYTRAMGERGFAMDQDRFSLEGIKQVLEEDKFGETKAQNIRQDLLGQGNLKVAQQNASTQASSVASANAARAQQMKQSAILFGEGQNAKHWADRGAQIGFEMASQTPAINGKAPTQREVMIAMQTKLGAEGATQAQIRAAVAGYQAADADMSMLDPKDTIKIADITKSSQAEIAEYDAGLKHSLAINAAKHAGVARVAAMNQQQFNIKSEDDMWEAVKKTGIVNNRVFGGGDINNLKEVYTSLNKERAKSKLPPITPAVFTSAVLAAPQSGDKENKAWHDVGAYLHVGNMGKLREDVKARQKDVDDYEKSSAALLVADNKARASYNTSVNAAQKKVLDEQKKLTEAARAKSYQAYKTVKPQK